MNSFDLMNVSILQQQELITPHPSRYRVLHSCKFPPGNALQCSNCSGYALLWKRFTALLTAHALFFAWSCTLSTFIQDFFDKSSADGCLRSLRSVQDSL